MRDLPHNVDPGDAVLVPYRVLQEAARKEALGDKVRAVSAFSLVAVIGRIVIDAILVRVRHRGIYVVVICPDCSGRHHFLRPVFGNDTEGIRALLPRLQGVFYFLLHPVKILIGIFNSGDLPAAAEVTV